MLLQQIADENKLALLHNEPVYGGDINKAWCLHTRTGRYFLKTNAANRVPLMFQKEAAGLAALKRHSPVTVPRVMAYGTINDVQYLLLEWLEKGVAAPGCMYEFGRHLAALHRQKQAYFGWQEDNYIGNWPQINTAHQHWHAFYITCRLTPLAQYLFDTGAWTKSDLAALEALGTRLEALFPPEPPALVHGDLWGGNFMIVQDGSAAIFDPAVYYGHREMDIGMTLLFGGFDAGFYQGYNDEYPLQKDWRHRVSLTQLYPLLVHAVLFGGHYVSSARDIIRQYRQDITKT